MRKIIVIIALALVTASAASAGLNSAALTKDQAFRTARACLKQHHARTIIRRGDGGGYVYFGGSAHAYWTYKTFLGQVESVTYYPTKLSRSQKRVLIACVTKGI